MSTDPATLSIVCSTDCTESSESGSEPPRNSPESASAVEASPREVSMVPIALRTEAMPDRVVVTRESTTAIESDTPASASPVSSRLLSTLVSI